MLTSTNRTNQQITRNSFTSQISRLFDGFENCVTSKILCLIYITSIVLINQDFLEYSLFGYNVDINIMKKCKCTLIKFIIFNAFIPSNTQIFQNLENHVLVFVKMNYGVISMHKSALKAADWRKFFTIRNFV